MFTLHFCNRKGISIENDQINDSPKEKTPVTNATCLLTQLMKLQTLGDLQINILTRS